MRIARIATAAVAATTLVVLTGGGPAWAHNALTKAVPAKNATVTKSPAEVELTFLDKLDDSFKIEVADAQKKKVPTGPTTVDGKKGTATFPDSLANGTYTVTYRLVADDGDAVEASYRFTVDAPSPAGTPAPAGTSAAPTPSASPDPVVSATAPATIAAADTSDDGPGWGLIAAIVAGIVAIGAIVFLVVRRKA